MSINKETPIRMHRRGETYVTVPSSTIAAINDGIALGVYVWIESHIILETETFTEEDVLAHFETMTRCEFHAAMGVLEDSGLLKAKLRACYRLEGES